MQILVAATTWFLVITALAAIATAVPHVVDTFRGGRTARPSPSVATEPQSRTDATSDQSSSEEQQDRCGDAVSGLGTGAGQENGTPAGAQGCPPKKAGGNAGGGRPDDPGSQGNGGAPGSQGSNAGSSGETGTTDDSVAHGSSDDHIPSGSGKPEIEQEHGPRAEAGQGARNG
jgi:hypothetical protein